MTKTLDQALRACRIVALTISPLFAAACVDTTLTRPTTVKSQDEAAAVLFSVDMVAPWDQVSDAMQPNFALTGDQALQQVAPTTARMQEQVLSAFGASLGLGLPQTSSQASTSLATSTTSATASGTTSQSTDTSSTSTSKQPGVAPQTPSGTPAGGQLPAAPAVAGDIGLDPILKYQAALALYQSVQMMNREVQHAASLKCYVPFLVKAKLSVLPYRPNLGYSVHARISFFPGPDTPQTPQQVQGQNEPKKPTTACADSRYLPQIVPILAADDIERALKSRAVEAAQQIGLALSFMVHGVGGNVGLNNLNQTLNAISSQDINSRLTVARQSDNTLYVRIGATNEATAGAGLVGQNYGVALLMLVPRSYFEDDDLPPRIQIVNYAQFRNAADGSTLPGRSSAELVRQADLAMEQVLAGPGSRAKLEAWRKLNNDDKESIARSLLGPIQQSRYTDFAKLFSKPLPPGVAPGSGLDLSDVSMQKLYGSLWTRMSVLLADSAMKSAFLELPAPTPVNIPDQVALLLDDTKDKAQVQLQNVSGASGHNIAPRLTLIAKDQAKTPYPFAAQAVDLDPVTRVLTLTFPSPTKWGMTDADPSSYLEVLEQSCSPEALCPKFIRKNPKFRLLMAKASGPDTVPNFTLTARLNQLVSNKGAGSATLIIDKLKDDSVTLSIDGADIASVTDGGGKPVAMTNSEVTVTQNAVLTFQLQNLRPGATVTFTAEGKKSAKSTGKRTLQFGVIAA